MSVEVEPRAICERCRRPTRVCVCAHLPTLSPRTKVLILQHPREERMPIGTAHMASRCLERSSVVVGTHVEETREVRDALADPSRRAILLWPGPDAENLATSPPEGPVTLIVVDGTWALAKKLVRLNPTIGALPRFQLTPEAPSEYRIRREPRAECLSTIEAIANALGVLEGDPAPYREMLRPFRAMVDAQIEHRERRENPRDRSRLRRKVRGVWTPPSTLEDPSRVVVVAAEANAWPIGAKDRHPDEIVHWLAIRGDGSERFEMVVRPTHPLAPSVASHTELSPETLVGGEERRHFVESWRRFVRDDDVIATWGTYATRLLIDAALPAGRVRVDLRRVAAAWLRRSPGSIERNITDLGLEPMVLGQGRGGRRLGFMRAMFDETLKPRRS